MTGYVPIDRITHGSWNGDAKAPGVYKIDTSAWGLPAGVKAVAIRLSARWAAVGRVCYAREKGLGAQVIVRAQLANRIVDSCGTVNCDANGDFEIVVKGTAANAWLEFYGYYL